MSNFRGNRGGFNRDRGRGNFGGRDGGNRNMYDATCAGCGDDCKLPFEPRGDKPVFCSQCFEERDGGSSRGGGRDDRRDNRRGGRRDDRRSFDRPQRHTIVCDECGDKCEVPFKPSNDKPVYCDDCFKSQGGNSKSNRSNNHSGRSGGNELKEIKEQLTLLNQKMDRFLSIFTPEEAEEKTSKKEEKTESKKKTDKKTKKSSAKKDSEDKEEAAKESPKKVKKEKTEKKKAKTKKKETKKATKKVATKKKKTAKKTTKK